MAATIKNLMASLENVKTATSSKGSSKKSTIPVLTYPSNPEGLAAIAGHFAFVSNQEKAAAELRKNLGAVIAQVVDDQRMNDGALGTYSKSYRIEGNNAMVTSTRANKWTVADKEADHREVAASLREALGDKFEELFEVEEVLEVTKDQELLREMAQVLLKAFGSEKAKKMLMRRTNLKVRGDLDVEQFNMTEEQVAAVHEQLKWAEAGLKAEGPGEPPNQSELEAEQKLVDEVLGNEAA